MVRSTSLFTLPATTMKKSSVFRNRRMPPAHFARILASVFAGTTLIVLLVPAHATAPESPALPPTQFFVSQTPSTLYDHSVLTHAQTHPGLPSLPNRNGNTQKVQHGHKRVLRNVLFVVATPEGGSLLRLLVALGDVLVKVLHLAEDVWVGPAGRPTGVCRFP